MSGSHDETIAAISEVDLHCTAEYNSAGFFHSLILEEELTRFAEFWWAAILFPILILNSYHYHQVKRNTLVFFLKETTDNRFTSSVSVSRGYLRGNNSRGRGENQLARIKERDLFHLAFVFGAC